MSNRTIFLARLFGLFMILAGLPILWQGRVMAETADAVIHTHPLVLLFGMIFLACGLATVLMHNVWSGGLLPVVVTILGWILLLRGIVLLFLTPEALIDLFGLFRVGQLIYLYAAIDLVIGIYLTIAGFSTARRDRANVALT